MSALSPSSVSSRITIPLKQVATRQWTVLAARGLVQTLVISLAVLLAVAIPLGKFEGMWVWLRIVLAALAWGTIIATGIYCLRPALQRWTLSHAAQVADEALPDTQERISSALELSQTTDQFRGSPELVAHLIRQAEQDATRVNATTVIPFRSVFIWAAVFVPVIGLWAGMMFFFPGMVERGLFFSVMPTRPAPGILSLVAIAPDKDQVALEGDSLQFSASVNVWDKKFAKRAELVQTFDATGKTVRIALEQDENKGTLFTHKLENLTQSFKYTVSTDRGDSQASFHVTVIPRPKIAGVDVTYQYPAYTGKPTETTHDLNIKAVVGTKVTVAVHTRDLEGSAANEMVITSGPKNQAKLALTPTAHAGVLEAKFDVTETPEQERAKQEVEKTYLINLTSAVTIEKQLYNATNKDVAHTITAVADHIPTIAIIAPKDLIKVRPDDDVPVIYEARDDFGVAHVEILVSVDDKPDHVIPIAIASANRKNFKQNWTLSVPAILKLEGVAQADHISFQLQATDYYPVKSVPDPDHLPGKSDRRTITIIQNQKQSYQEHLNEIAKLKLEEAIQKAIRELTVEGVPVAQVRDALASPRGALPAEYLEKVAKVGTRIGTTGTDLSASASEFVETPPFAQIAKEAQKIADNDIKKAASDTTSIVENKKLEVAKASYEEVIKARDDLQKLLEKLKKQAEALEALNEAKKLQEEVAKAMAEHPENLAENLKKQQEAIAKLQEAEQKGAIPQDPKAAEQAKALAELQKDIAKDQQKQAELQNQTAKQEEQQQAQQAANALAEEQKKLNEEVKEFAKADKQALDQAKAAVPEQKQQEQLVQNIEKNQLQTAAQQAQQAADQLKQDAQKLDQQAQNAAKAPAATPEQQKQQEQDKQNQQAAAQAEKQANQAAQAEKQAVAPEAKAAEAAKQAEQNVEKAAQAIVKQADKIEKDNAAAAKNPAVDKAAEAAKADAQEAAKDAQAAAKADNAQEAQKDAAKAAQELAKAGQELAQAAQAEKANQPAAAQAQKQADQAAQAEQAAAAAQEQNAQAADQAAKNVEKAAAQIEQQANAVEQQNQKGANDPAVNKAADAAKADAQEAAKDAQAAAKAADAQNAQEAQQDAAKAAQALAKAGQELAQAAQGEAKADAAQAQKQNQDAAAQAGEQAKGLAEKQQAIAQQLAQQAAQQADAQQNAAAPQQAADQQKQLAQQTQQAQQAAQQLAQQAQAEQNPNLAQRADQAAKALEQAAQAQQDAAKADAAGKPADAAQAQANAQQDLAKADQALRGDPANAQAQADAAKADPANAEQGKGEQGKPEQGQAGQPEQGQGQPQQTAAQAAAEAAQAQQQALQPNPAAAAEAAQALAQAAQAAQQGPPGPPEAGNEPGHEPGDHPGQETNTTPHQASDPKQGITGTDTGGDNKVPESVKKMGITASDWSKLPKTARIELENRSRQPMHPGYAEQIGSYFLRQAHIEKEHAPAGK